MTKRRKVAKKAKLAKKAKAKTPAKTSSKLKVRRQTNAKRGVKPAQSKRRVSQRGKPAKTRRRQPKAVSTTPRHAPTGFSKGPAYVAIKRRLGREPTESELKPTTRDYAIVDVLVQAMKWQGRAHPLIEASSAAAMREMLSPAGEAMLNRRAFRYLSKQEEAEKRALRAYQNGTLEREYLRIAQETGLTPREIYSLALSPPSMGVAA